VNIINKEIKFAYISYQIEDLNKKYSVIKPSSFHGYPSSGQLMTVKDQDGNLILNENLIEKINKVILEYNS
jgi:hypothetical protein